MIKFKYPVPFSTVAFATLLLGPALSANAQSILLTAENFALLGGTGVTSTGVVGTVITNGNIGLSPNEKTGITGFPPAEVVNGSILDTGGVTGQARLDLITAQVGLAGMATTTLMSNVDLGGKTLTPGVYTFDGAATQSGALVLDAQGKNNVSWVFQIGTSLTTTVNSTVTIINVGSKGGVDYGVFWNAGAEIIFGANNQVLGNYLSGTSITLGAASMGSGRDLALAAISLDNNQLTVNGGLAGSDWDGALIYDAQGNVVSSGIVAVSAPGSYTPGMSGVVITPGADTNTASIEIDGNIADGSGSTSLTVSSSSATLSGTNTYTGGTIIDGGTLFTASSNLPVDGAIALTNGGELVFNQVSDGSFGGMISGDGSLTKEGAADLTLTGANTYTGATTVQDGRLIVTTASLPMDGSVVLENGGALVFDQTTDGSFGGVISGDGALIKQNSGSVTLTGANTYTGATEVNGGTLVVNTTSLPGDVSVASGSSLMFDQAVDGSFAGVISGSGALVKAGDGSLTLTSANTYTGGTTITGGTINVSGAGTLGDMSNSDLAVDGGTLDLGGTSVTTDAVSFGGGTIQNGTVDGTSYTSTGGTVDVVLQGAGSFTNTSGTTTLLRDNTYTGGTTVSGGDLVLGTALTPGSTGPGAVMIASGAFLRGNGTINGSLINSGTVSPGFSPGTIIVAGDYTQTAGGTLVVEFASAVDFDKLIVGGAANLDGTLQLDALGGYDPVGETFEIITAAGGVNGVFTAETGSAAVAANVVYGANNVEVSFVQIPFASFAGTPNQTAIATAAQNSPALTTALNAVPLASDVPAALNAISPQGYQVWSDLAFAHSASLGDRLRRQPGATEGHDDFYFEAAQSRGSFSGDQDVGSSRYTSDSGLVGGNHFVSENLTLGGFFEYTETDSGMGSAGSNTTVKSKMPGIRAAWKKDAWFANAIAAYGFDDYESTRAINFPGTSATAKSETTGRQWVMDVSGGRRFQAGPVSLSPFAGLQASGWKADGFTETGAGAANATVGSQKARSLRTQLGLEAAVAFDVGSIQLRPHARGAWIHELSNDSRSIDASLGGSSFAVQTRDPQRDSARLSAGLDVVLTPTVSLYADYSVQTGDTTRVIGEWRGGLAVRF